MNEQDDRLYVTNPVVSCREEGPDGALLFNPDTDQVLVINPTGLLIWRALAEPHTQAEVIAVLKEKCHHIPEEMVQQDVSEFTEQLHVKEFVSACE